MADYDEGVTRKPDVYKYGEDFSRFIKRYEDFTKIAKLGENLHLVLLSLVDDHTYDILCKVWISDGISTDMGAIGKLYKEVMGSQEDVNIWRGKLLDIKQYDGEGVEDYGRRLQEMALHAYPDGDGEGMKVSVFIKGLRNEKQQLALYQGGLLTYEKAVIKVRRLEKAELLIGKWRNEEWKDDKVCPVQVGQIGSRNGTMDAGYGMKRARFMDRRGMGHRARVMDRRRMDWRGMDRRTTGQRARGMDWRDMDQRVIGQRARVMDRRGVAQRGRNYGYFKGVAQRGSNDGYFKGVAQRGSNDGYFKGVAQRGSNDVYFKGVAHRGSNDGSFKGVAQRGSNNGYFKQGVAQRGSNDGYFKGVAQRGRNDEYFKGVTQRGSNDGYFKGVAQSGSSDGYSMAQRRETKGKYGKKAKAVVKNWRKDTFEDKLVNEVDRSSNSIYAVAMVCGLRARVFIDTGASVTMVSKELVSRLGVCEMVRPCKVKIRSFTRDQVPVEGQVDLEIEMGGQIIKQNCIVSGYNDTDILVGMDYLKKAKAVLNIPKGELRTPQGVTRFINNPKSVMSVKRVKCYQTTTVPANSVSYIKRCFPQKNKASNVSGIFFSNQQKTMDEGVLMANSLVYSEGNEVILQVVNPNDEDVTLMKGKVLGDLRPVEFSEGLRGVHVVKDEGEEYYGAWKGKKEFGERVKQSGGEKEKVKSWEKNKLYDALRVNEMEINCNEKEKMKDLLWIYRDCFSVHSMDLGRCNMYEADIQLKPEAKAKWIANRPAPYQLRGVMDEKVRELEKAGIVEKYDGNSPWNSPTMLVKKGSSNEYRVVQDGRYLNSQTVPDSFEMPSMQRVLDELQDCKYLSSMDITSSFNQVPLTERSKPLTAFMHNNEQYIFNMMTQGSRTSSAKFCRMMSKLLGKVPFSSILSFIDDLLVGSGTFDSHMERLKFVLGKLKMANLKVKPSKCFFFRKEISFLGYTVSKDGVKIDNSRIQPILDLKPPTNVKGVQSIIGMFNFNRNFIKNFAAITKPLYQLLKKEQKFKWTQECQNSLDALKKALTEAPILCIPDIEDKNKSFSLKVEVDSSGVGWGAVLSQVIDGKRRTVAYYSKSIPKFKRKLGASRLEFLGMYHALKHWRHYLLHADFEVVTDCMALTSLETLFHKSSTIQQRQLQELQDYNMTITHISGVSNVIPDFLSRYNYEDQAITVSTQTELKDIQDRKIGAVKSEEGNVKKGKVNKVSKVKDGEVKDGEVKDGKVNSVKDGEVKDDEVKDGDFIDGDFIEFDGDFMDSDFMDSGFMDLKGDEFMDYGDGRSCKDGGHADLEDLRCEIRADLIEEMRERIRDEIWEEVKEGLVDELRKEVKEELKRELWEHVSKQEKHGSADYKLECVDGVKRRSREGPLETIWEGQVGNHEDCGDHVMMTGSAGKEQYPEIEHSVIYDQAPLEKKIQPVTMAEIRGETDKDPVLKMVAGWLQKGERPKSIQNTMQPDSLVSLWKSYELLSYKEGIVYRRWTALKQPFMEKDLIVVPHVLQERLLTYYHCGVLSVHAGVETCLGNCLRIFWWSKMRKEFKLFIGACVKCNHIKRPRAYLKAPLQPILNSQFNSCVAIDHIVPSLNNKCFGGFRYILTIVDCFSN